MLSTNLQINPIRSSERSLWDRRKIAVGSSIFLGLVGATAFGILAFRQVATSLGISDLISNVSLENLSIKAKIVGCVMIATGPLACIAYRDKSASLDKKLSTFAHFVYIIIDLIRPLFKIIEFFIDKNRKRCFSLKALSKKVNVHDEMIQHAKNDNIQQRIQKIYDSFCDIHRGKPHGFGTCYVRTYAVTQALLTGKRHNYAHTLRATVDPINYEKHFNSKIQSIKDDAASLNNLTNGTLLIFARPLTDKFSNFFNRCLNNTSSQLSHVCNGIVLDGQIYILEMSHGKLEASPPQSATIFEPLNEFQSRMAEKNVPKLNLFLPIGIIHPSILNLA